MQKVKEIIHICFLWHFEGWLLSFVDKCMLGRIMCELANTG